MSLIIWLKFFAKKLIKLKFIDSTLATLIAQCSPASVGLAQARPNYRQRNTRFSSLITAALLVQKISHDIPYRGKFSRVQIFASLLLKKFSQF